MDGSKEVSIDLAITGDPENSAQKKNSQTSNNLAALDIYCGLWDVCIMILPDNLDLHVCNSSECQFL